MLEAVILNYYIIGGVAVVIFILIIFLATRKKPDPALLSSIASFNADWLSLQQHYISLSQLRQLQSTYRSAYQFATGKQFSEFRTTYNSLPSLVKAHNDAFVPTEIQSCSGVALIFDKCYN